MLSYKCSDGSGCLRTKMRELCIYKKNDIIENSGKQNKNFNYDSERLILIIKSITNGTETKNIIGLIKGLEELVNYLDKKCELLSKELLCIDLWNALFKFLVLNVEDNVIGKVKNLIMKCAAKLTFLTSDFIKILFHLKFFENIFCNNIRTCLSIDMKYYLCCLYNALCDEPDFINKIELMINLEDFLDLFCNEKLKLKKDFDDKTIEMISAILIQYTNIKYNEENIIKIMLFFKNLLKSKQYFKFKISINGLFSLFKAKVVNSNLFYIFDDFPDFLTESISYDDEIIILWSLYIISYLNHFFYKGLNFDFTCICCLCIDHINDRIGYSAYETLKSVLENSNETFIEMLLYDFDFLNNILIKGLLIGSFSIIKCSFSCLKNVLICCNSDTIMKIASIEINDIIEKICEIDDLNIITQFLECINILLSKAYTFHCIDIFISMFSETNLLNFIQENINSDDFEISFNSNQIMDLLSKV